MSGLLGVLLCADLFISVVWEDDWCWQIREFLEVWLAEMVVMKLLDKDWLGIVPVMRRLHRAFAAMYGSW